MPAGWAQYTNDASGLTRFGVTQAVDVSGQTGSGQGSLEGDVVDVGGTSINAYAWQITPLPADQQVSAALLVPSPDTTNGVPAELLARASGLDGSAPTFYYASLQVLVSTLGHASGGINPMERAWDASQSLADVEVSAEIYLATTTMVEVFARGSNLGAAGSNGNDGGTYYALRLIGRVLSGLPSILAI